ncbi:MAG TPA: hypothetical protein VI233_12200, partial [Puia sp.]
MSKLLNPFQSLSLTDLLDAREAFHIHLINKENVIGTAIGKYRVRLQEGPGEKTLTNTKVDESSWPCILVFVDQWVPYEEFRKKDLDSFIPSTVFLPDGRRVPLCVIKAPSGDASGDLIAEEEILFPSDFIGGGYPLIIQSQGIERVASIGCVVSDGNKYYALTNRHVAGPAGTTVYTRVKGTLVPIGVSTDKFLGNKSFESLYKGFKGSNMVTNVDAALIEIKDYNFWKTDIFGLGTLGKLFDINTSNLTLDIIGSPVRAYGSISGELTAEISALFYRYKSVGGMEFVSDFLMGPRDGDHPLDTRHGDSGTLWVIDTPMAAGAPLPTGTPAPTAPGVKPEFRPIAIQWGQHCFVQGSEERKFNFALGTCLSNVLRELEVDIVGGWNSGSDYTWGEVGHYTIANFATDLVANPQLKKLIDANLELITFKKDTLQTDSAIKRQRKTLDFTPLADVPDLVWKLVGGPFKRPLENPNHFADMDKPDSNNKRLLDLCSGTGDNMKFLSPAEWLSYYSDPAVRDSSKGILPFRVWQIFLQMVDFARRGNTASFVAAAGVLAHYVGDACQPLHISFMFNGKPVPGQPGQKIGEDVHEAFESKLVNKHNKEIIVSVQALIKT